MSDNNFGEELGQLPPDLTLGATSEQIMRRGRRIRRVRQSSVAGAAAIAVFGITATGVAFAGRDSTQVVHPASGGVGLTVSSPTPTPTPSPSPVPASAVASPIASSAAVGSGSAGAIPEASSISASSSCSPAPQSDVGAPAAIPDGNPPPWGSVITVGTDRGKSVVLYGFHISQAAIPCSHFGLMLGTIDSSGATSRVTGVYAANEFDGSDLTPGIHAASLTGGGNQINAWYLIGYYVGGAASVSVDEKAFASPVTATVVPWSVNPDVKFWWVSGTGAVPTFGQLHATDANGTALPIGTHGQQSVG